MAELSCDSTGDDWPESTCPATIQVYRSLTLFAASGFPSGCYTAVLLIIAED
jgi:hypothetical protein